MKVSAPKLRIFYLLSKSPSLIRAVWFAQEACLIIPINWFVDARETFAENLTNSPALDLSDVLFEDRADAKIIGMIRITPRENIF